MLVNRVLNVSFVNCTQTNDINDRTYWGVMASNYSKNLLYDNCVWSRFDAHMGVANATIRNSTPSCGFAKPCIRSSSGSRQSLMTTLGEASERP